MPKHPDFTKVYNNMIKKYGKKKGKEVYFSWLNKNNLNDTRPMPKHVKGEQMGKFDITYFAGIDDVKIVAEERVVAGEKVKVKKAILSGTLMDDKPNANNWQAHKPSFPIYAESIPRAATKVQHDGDDWKIIGSGIKGVDQGSSVGYELEIANPEAVAKFETGEWNARIMGVSPNIRGYTKATCSICGNDSRDRKKCTHHWGETYEKGKCIITPEGGYVGEISLTSTPAYFPRAGTIDSVSFAASLKESLNIEEIDMTDFEAKLKEKEDALIALTAQLEDKDTKIVELEKKLDAEENDDDKPPAKPSEPEGEPPKDPPADPPADEGGDDEGEGDGEDDKEKEAVEAMTKERDTLKAELKTIKDETRKVELEKVTSNEKIVASILAKDLADEQFEAELEYLKEMKAMATGSAPVEGQKNKDPEKEFESMFGSTKKEFIRELVTGRDLQEDDIQKALAGD